MSLEAAPEWIQAEFQKVAAGAPRIDGETTRAGVIRDRILAAMRLQNMTQAELAAQIGRDPASISRTLSRPDRSRLSTLHEIAAALKLAPGRLVG